jgi:hypothetical protein
VSKLRTRTRKGAGDTATKQTLTLDYPVYPRPRWGYGHDPHPELDTLIGSGAEQYGSLLSSFLTYEQPLAAIPLDAHTDAEPSWHNGWFQGLDAVALYCILASRNPRHYCEVGSGSSTKFARRAVHDIGLRTEIVSIDPQPRAEIDALCDRVIRARLEETDLSFFETLQEGDIAFFDSSHRCFMNSDVTVAFVEVLPRLAPGVLVHFHDIFLPWDYPPQMRERYYSEQYLLAAALLSGPERFEILLPNFFVTIHHELHNLLAPLWSRLIWAATPINGLSFWMIKR